MTTSTQCLECRHYKGLCVCEAYPEGIPQEIFDGRVDHTERYPGDMGFAWEPRDNAEITKGEKRVHVKAHQTKSGVYVKDHYRMVEEGEGTEEKDNIESTINRMEDYIKNDDRVNPTMLDSVMLYSSERYEDINSSLRDGDLEDYADLIEDVNNISEFIKNAPKFDGIVYRGINEFDDSDDFDEFIDQLTNCDTITFPAFISCSTEKNVAEIFTGSDRSILFNIISTNGVILNNASDIPDENEVLFDYGTDFDVVSVENNNGKYLIKLREISND